MKRTLQVVISWGLALLAATAAMAQSACECSRAGYEPEPGLVWRSARDPSFLEIVRSVAPVLWYSPDEPLLASNPVLPIANPCDTLGPAPVVYYQVPSLLLRGNADVTEPIQDDPRFFPKVRSVSLKFFFYYPADVGMGSHAHDVEGAEFEIDLVQAGGGCREVYLRRVRAMAHGQEMLQNTLRITADTRLPVTLLVEEGKHASCPDRNADGVYTPGYDVNEASKEAWGVRDVFGAGFLGGSAYNSSMTKSRRRETRTLPPDDEPAECIPRERTSYRAGQPALGRYELRPGASLTPCPRLGAPSDSAFLHKDMMIHHGFGAESHPLQYGSELTKRFARLDDPYSLIPSVALRYDQQEIGFSFMVRGVDLGEGWLVPRVNLCNGISTELLFTPTASSWSSAYGSMGWEWEKAETEDVDGVQVETEPRRDDFVAEFGIKFRVGLPDNSLRWLALGYRYGGLRFGIRFNGFDHMKNARAVAEIGAGAF
jgi:hypothetical protein